MPDLRDDEFYECVPAGELVLRLSFEPEHFKDGRPIPGIMGLRDLEKNGYSVDREHLAERAVIENRISAQMTSAKRPASRVKRDYALIVKIDADAVRAESDDKNRDGLIVCCSPELDNSAHANMLTAVKRGEGALRMLRDKIVEKHFNNYLLFADYAGQRWAPPLEDRDASHKSDL